MNFHGHQISQGLHINAHFQNTLHHNSITIIIKFYHQSILINSFTIIIVYRTNHATDMLPTPSDK